MSLLNHKSLAFFFGFVLFVKLFLDLDYILGAFDSYGRFIRWDPLKTVTLVSLIFLLLGSILIFRKNKIGWFFLLMFSLYAVFNLIGMSLRGLNILGRSRTMDYPAFPVFDPITSGLFAVLFAFTTFGLCQKSIRNELGVSENLMVGIVSLESLILFVIVFMF